MDVHLYRFQVTPKSSHLSAVKRIFRYLKGKPKLGLWYPRVSSFDLESYSDSDYAGANLDRKSTTGGCQFLGRRLISWQCKKQTIVATSTTEAEYVAAQAAVGKFCGFKIKCLRGFRESLRRVIDGTEALLLSTLFILWLDIVSTDSAKLVPLGKVCTAIETLKKNTAKGQKPTCYEYGDQGHYKSDYPELKNRNHENQAEGTEAHGMVYALGGGETDQDPNNIEDEIET
ncbi:hypothetical protein Tco_0945168 [Tanacetum coccineum]